MRIAGGAKPTIPCRQRIRTTSLSAPSIASCLTGTRVAATRATRAIFIVGLPRSGSTLIEQILGSHPDVEGTHELPDLGRVARSTGVERTDRKKYPAVVAELERKDLYELGSDYLQRTERHRELGRPRFTDKMPNNFAHVGFLQLILPNAKIIDARRHPLDSCLGSYKQLFARGQPFTYDLFELGEFYLEYDRLMRHWHEVLPGKVLRLQYEDLVQDLEGQVRRLLDYCDLPWDDACLRFFESDRAVKTASSEQVRTPIYSSSLHRWRNYEQQLRAPDRDPGAAVAGTAGKTGGLDRWVRDILN